MSKFLMFALRARNKLLNRFISQYRILSSNVASPKYNNDSQTSNNNRYNKEICLVAAGFVGYILYKENFFKFPTVQAVAAEPPMKGKRETFNFIADAVHVAAPSVVYIEIKDPRRVDYFTGQPATLSNGSGFIVREDGLILTNAHVVVNKPNTIVHVKLHDGNTYIAKLVDIDVTSDLATIRIPMKNLPAMKLGLSSDLKAGEWVVALGSPLTLSNTVTAGVVSSTMRAAEDLGLRGKDITYIQTDAAITFGNSGGPLVNLDGEAIGINSMKVAPGISFAIPIDYAKEFLSRSGKDRMQVSKKYLGITMLSLTASILREVRERNSELRADITHGVLVWKVIVGSPAHSGGLQPGDIVTHFNGQAIYAASDVYKILNSTTSKTLTVRIIRNNNILELNVKPEVANNA